MGGANNLVYLLTEGLRFVRENIFTAVLTSITLGFSLAILALFFLIFLNLNALVRTWGDRTHIVAYVKDGAQNVDSIRQSILNITGVKAAEYVSKDGALKSLKEELKDHQGILQGVDANPLPASFEIKLTESSRENPASTASIVQKLRKMEWAEEVQYSQEWVERFSAFLRFVELAAVIIGLFLSSATVFIISNTIRLAVYARKEEIEVMRLVGASNLYIKAPFFIEGVLQGAAGGTFALAFLAFCRYILITRIPPYFKFIINAPVPSVTILVVLLLSGIFMGVTGSLISMSRFLKI